MEKQFILRLPETLRNINHKDCKLVKTTPREVSFLVGDKSYPGIICKLPTIVESQKIVDNKLYKIADISTLVVIYPDRQFNLEEEIFKHESSGVTPPMFYAKERRFAKTIVRTEEVEKIEKKVAELLKADSQAKKVEILTDGMEKDNMDIDVLAAEIENELEYGRQPGKKQFNESDRALSTSELTTEKNLMVDNPQKGVDELIKEENESMNVKDPGLLELEEKIKEKKEQFEKAVNPILKKRFEQALETLKAELMERMKKKKSE